MEGKATTVGASEPGKRTSFISSLRCVARLMRPRKLCARLACSTSNLKDLPPKKEPH